MGWTTLLNSLFLPGKPILGSTGAALRDNIVSVPKGEPGAERIVGAAHKRLADMPVLAVGATDTFDAGTLVDVVLGTASTTSSSFVTARTMTVRRGTGSLRFRLTQSFTSGDLQEVRIQKNGSTQANWNTGTPNSARSADISVVPGDVITYDMRRSGGTTGPVSLSQVGVFGSDSYLERPAWVSQLTKDVV